MKPRLGVGFTALDGEGAESLGPPSSTTPSPTAMSRLLGLLLLGSLAACSSVPPRLAPPADHLDVDAPRAQLFDGLGSYGRPITTNSSEAQVF